MGLPNAYRTRHPVLGTSSCPASSFSTLPPPPPPPSRSPPPPLSLLSFSFSFLVYVIISISHLLAPCSRAFLLLEGTTFFLVAPAMGGAQTGLCPTNEKRDRGNASPGVLRQWRPSSSTTHRIRPSLSLSSPHWSLAHSSSSFSLTVQPWLSFSFREPRLCFSSRASFLLRILIFFINFSPSSPDGSPSSSFSLFLCLPISLQSLGLRYLLLSPHFPSSSRDISSACIREIHDRLSFSQTTYVFGPLRWGCFRANVLVPPRETAFVRRTTETWFLISRFTSFPSRMFCF